MGVCKTVFVHCWTYHGHGDQRPLPYIAGDGNVSVHITSVHHGCCTASCTQTHHLRAHTFGMRTNNMGDIMPDDLQPPDKFNVPERVHARVLYPRDMCLLRIGTSTRYCRVNNTNVNIDNRCGLSKCYMDSSRKCHVIYIGPVDWLWFRHAWAVGVQIPDLKHLNETSVRHR